MQVNAIQQGNVTPEATPVTQAQDKRPLKAPVQQPQAPQKDAVLLSQKAKDLAALLSGKTVQEEGKESPVIEAQEEQAKVATGK